MKARAFHLSPSLKVLTTGFLAVWLLIAAFPLVWITTMSIKLPVDAFADNPFKVILGFDTRTSVGGISILTVLVYGAAGYVIYFVGRYQLTRWVDALVDRLRVPVGASRSVVAAFVVLGLMLGGLILLFVVCPAVTRTLGPVLGPLATPLIGATWQHFVSVWVGLEFYRQLINSVIVTFGVVLISLTVGTLAGYGLARTQSSLAFWLLIAALIFRALPHSVLVTGYLPPAIELGLYGNRGAVIVVLVAINQPFTIWMLRSFFMNIPQELDEAALVDGCGRFEAFWRVIMPVMWPGVITTGLFSFLLAYNDFLVTSLLLNADTLTMVPSIAAKFNRETTTTDQVEAIAAAVSITAPLFLLVLVFQRQIVSGLTAGAVKG